MATTKSLIDDILRYVDGVSPSAGDYLARRRRCKRNLQRELDELWATPQLAPLSRFFATPPIIVAGGRCYLDVPAARDFVGLGSHGVVTVDRIQLAWVAKQRLEELYQVNPGQTGQPSVYSEGELTGANPNTFAIYVWPPLASASGHVASIAYQFASPTLVDSDDVGAGEPTGTDGLTLINDLWHPTLYEFGAWRQMLDKGNTQQAAPQFAIAQRALRNMIVGSRVGAAVPTRIPAFGARRFR